MTTARYFLGPSIQWCFVSDRCIILDVENDRYLQVPARGFSSLLPYLTANCSDIDVPDSGLVPTALRAVAEEFLAADILTLTPPAAQWKRSGPVPTPTDFKARAPSAMSAIEVMAALPQFALACAKADHYLRHLSFKRISMRISQRKHMGTHLASTRPLEEVITLARRWHRLRPFYPRNYLCLFDSLALLEFLALWNIYPDWVFGVTVDPFLAHCWVQHGTEVLCDSVCFASRWYSPIMVL